MLFLAMARASAAGMQNEALHAAQMSHARSDCGAPQAMTTPASTKRAMTVAGRA